MTTEVIGEILSIINVSEDKKVYPSTLIFICIVYCPEGDQLFFYPSSFAIRLELNLFCHTSDNNKQDFQRTKFRRVEELSAELLSSHDLVNRVIFLFTLFFCFTLPLSKSRYNFLLPHISSVSHNSCQRQVCRPFYG